MPRSNVPKKTIAVDIDDVIAAEAEYIVDYSNKRWGHSLSLDDYREHWRDMWQVDDEEVERRADELISANMVNSMRVLDDVHEALVHLAKKFRLIIITSRRKLIEKETRNWLKDNFGDVFDEIHFTGIWDAPNKDAHSQTKTELAQKLKVDYLIDDQPKHCFSAADAGVQAVLFGDYFESRNLDLPKGVTRCKNWREVLEYFHAED